MAISLTYCNTIRTCVEVLLIVTLSRTCSNNSYNIVTLLEHVLDSADLF